MNEDGTPFTKTQVDAGFKDMIKRVIPEAQRFKFSFHSYRIWLACALDSVPLRVLERLLKAALVTSAASNAYGLTW